MAVAHWPATPAPSRETRFAPPVGRRYPCPRSSKASRKTSPLHRFRPVPGYGACRFCRACTLKRMADAVSGLLRREDRRPPCACSVCRGSPRCRGSGPAISTLIRKVSGLRRYRPGRFVREAAMTNTGLLAGMWRCMSPHVFAIVMARSGRLLSALRPMRRRCRPTRIMKDVGAEACPRSWVQKKAAAATGACFDLDDAPKGAHEDALFL
jgi:hypothetical protein